MNILQRRMASQGILNDTQTTLADYLMSIAQISVEDAGAIYIELSSIRGIFMANIILRMIENYHFLPDMAQKLKNKLDHFWIALFILVNMTSELI